MSPSPPALLTADASSHPLHQIIPAWIMGNSIPKSSVIRVFMDAKVVIRGLRDDGMMGLWDDRMMG
jgi:hypothetical protein